MYVFKLNQTTRKHCVISDAGNYFHIIFATMLRFGSVMTGAADSETGVVLYSYFLYERRDNQVLFFIVSLTNTDVKTVPYPGLCFGSWSASALAGPLFLS